MKVLNSIKAHAGKIKEDAVEVWTMALITVGIPVIAYIFVGWKWAFVAFVVTQITVGLLSLHFGDKN